MRLHNMLSRRTEPLMPLAPGGVSVCICVSTVYKTRTSATRGAVPLALLLSKPNGHPYPRGRCAIALHAGQRRLRIQCPAGDRAHQEACGGDRHAGDQRHRAPQAEGHQAAEHTRGDDRDEISPLS